MGLILHIELLNVVLRYVENNLENIQDDLPEEMIIILNKHHCGLQPHNFNSAKWLKFIDILFLNRDLNWDAIDYELNNSFYSWNEGGSSFFFKIIGPTPK